METPMQFTSITYSENCHTWNITMTGNGWPWMMKLAKASFRCPDCGTTNIRKNGYTSSKHKPQYQCLNDKCKRVSFI